MSSLKFEEHQSFRQPWVYIIYILLFALLGLFVYADYEQIILGQPFGDKPAPDIVLILITLLLLTFVALLHQTKLETLITDKGVSFRWKPFQRTCRTFAWDEVDKFAIIHYGFVGYGLRLTPPWNHL